MENDLRTAYGKGGNIQWLLAFEYPIIPDVRLQCFARLVDLEALMNHMWQYMRGGFHRHLCLRNPSLFQSLFFHA